jgi:Family of unknown function (DUF1028)
MTPAGIWGWRAEAALIAYRSSSGPTLGGRLMDALVVADRLGGDLRGRQSAALRVVTGEPASTEALPDLRVDDSRDPVGDLSALHRLWEAHQLLRASRDADGLYRDVTMFEAALALAPDDEACLRPRRARTPASPTDSGGAAVAQPPGNHRAADRRPDPAADRQRST